MPAAPLSTDHHDAVTADGWALELKRTVAGDHFRSGTRPLLILPGYGMNAFIFGYHPRGTSMERSLAEAGFEVWSANLRGQGASRRRRADAPGPSLTAYVGADLPALIDTVLGRSRTGAGRLDLVGCSLGGSLAYAHLAVERHHRVAGLVTMGSPLRWQGVHPLLRLAFSSPRLVGALPFAGTRRLAQASLGVLTRFPRLLSIYMNAGHVDLSAASELARTVEDPIPLVNREIAEWMQGRDLVMDGKNVTAELGRLDLPLLVVVSNRDGIVPRAANLSVVEAWGGGDVEVLHVGDDEDWYAHADLFIAHQAPERVFAPIARWLHDRR